MDTTSTVVIPSAYAELAAQLNALNTPEEITRVLRIPTNTLNYWRAEGKGPRFIKIGRSIYYSRDDVFDYLQSQVFGSTAEAKQAQK